MDNGLKGKFARTAGDKKVFDEKFLAGVVYAAPDFLFAAAPIEWCGIGSLKYRSKPDI